VKNYPWAAEEWLDAQKIAAPEFVEFINDALENHQDQI
jgi:hypothetical protein